MLRFALTCGPGAIAGALALVAVPVAGVTPAWSATTCPAKLVAPLAGAVPGAAGGTSAGETCEEKAEEEAERVEEQQEDEEEEAAIAAERAAAAAKDAAEEAAEEAAEASGSGAGAGGSADREPHGGASHGSAHGGASHGSGSARDAKLRLLVDAETIRLLRHGHPAETRISVASSVPARVRVRVRGHGLNRTIYLGDSSDPGRYYVRVLWGCLSPARKFAYTVTAYAIGETGTGTGPIVSSRGRFTVDSSTVCRSH